MKFRSLLMAATATLALTACAGFPELDGVPVTPIRAASFNAVQAPAWRLDFGQSSLARMLAEADSQGLDAAAARARLLSADLALAQSGRQGRVTPSGGFGIDNKSSSYNAGLTYEVDLAGRFDAAMSAAKLEHQAAGLDMLIARQNLGRAVSEGWVALAEARTIAARSASDIEAEQNALTQLRARAAAGETTGADLAAREQSLVAARVTAAEARGNIALAEARLRALGVRTIPSGTSLKGVRRPPVGARTDLRATAASPGVCAAWLRFHASDATRAETLAASRPRLVVTSSLAATASTLAGLIAGNAAAVTNSVRLDGSLIDDGTARNRLDQARISVAQSEIAWMQAASRAEVAALEAIVAQQGAEAGLDAAMKAHAVATADLRRARLRHEGGVADGLELAEAERSVATAQRGIDTARAAALRAAVAVHAAMPAAVPGCMTTSPAPVTRTAAAGRTAP